MLGLNVFAAETDSAARVLFTSLQQAVINLRTGRPGPLPPPAEDLEGHLDSQATAILRSVLTCAVVGSPQTLEQGLASFVDRYTPDEIMVTAQIFDHAARLKSYEILSETWRRLNTNTASERQRRALA
jgi:alkanesulfonate monooxygenase SsuD/methylene tetrahydromethanopterin reductase-like flavin-dependent oxidoreductase (luciferase family)